MAEGARIEHTFCHQTYLVRVSVVTTEPKVLCKHLTVHAQCLNSLRKAKWSTAK